MKILSAEDECTSRMIINSFFSLLGEVDIAVNGDAVFTGLKFGALQQMNLFHILRRNDEKNI